MINGLALCSGIGGLELGVSRALGGHLQCVGYVERDAFAASTLVARMEDASLDPAPVWDDLESFDGGAWRGCVDLITAGFPCQPFSVAGKRLGKQDHRWLWPLVARIIRDVGPSVVFLENTPGIVKHGLDAVLGDLAELGFDAEWDLFRAKDVGAPHRRTRWFLLAHAVGAELREQPWWRSRTGGQDPSGSGCTGQGLVHADRAGLEGRGSPEPSGTAGTLRSGGDVGHTMREGRRLAPTREGGSAHEGRSLAHGGHPGLADAHSERLGVQRIAERTGVLGETRGVPERRRHEWPFAWPPGRSGDEARWATVDPRFHPAVRVPVEPGVRRVAHGIPNRVDRLRSLGNAVVPAQAELAFGVLWQRLVEG